MSLNEQNVLQYDEFIIMNVANYLQEMRLLLELSLRKKVIKVLIPQK